MLRLNSRAAELAGFVTGKEKHASRAFRESFKHGVNLLLFRCRVQFVRAVPRYSQDQAFKEGALGRSIQERKPSTERRLHGHRPRLQLPRNDAQSSHPKLRL